MCKVQDDSNGVPNCTDVAPANSFEPDIQWTWTGPNGETNSIVTPLVANLTDDNGDGAIDLCDIPDVVVVASTGAGQPNEPGHIYLLDGQTGAQELMIPTTVDGTVTPALGDLDQRRRPRDRDGRSDRPAVGVPSRRHRAVRTGRASGPATGTPVRSRSPTSITTATSRSSAATRCSTTTAP